MIDERAFNRAYRDNVRGVGRYIESVREKGHLLFIDRDDAVQETFVLAWRHWSRRTSANLRAWLIGIARNVMRRMRRDYFGQAKGRAATVTANSGEYDPECDDRSIQGNQESAVELTQIRRLFDRLGPTQAEHLRALSYGESARDISDRKQVSLSSVTVAISLGRRRLKEALAASAVI